MGVDDTINPCSEFYTWGGVGGFFTSFLIPGAGIVKVGQALEKIANASQIFAWAAKFMPVPGLAGKPSVVIGRGMDRVREAASILNAATYEASRLTTALAKLNFTKPMLLENKLWLQAQMFLGHTIYDIGHGAITTPSIFYNMERAIVNGYSGHAPLPWVK